MRHRSTTSRSCPATAGTNLHSFSTGIKAQTSSGLPFKYEFLLLPLFKLQFSLINHVGIVLARIESRVELDLMSRNVLVQVTVVLDADIGNHTLSFDAGDLGRSQRAMHRILKAWSIANEPRDREFSSFPAPLAIHPIMRLAPPEVAE